MKLILKNNIDERTAYRNNVSKEAINNALNPAMSELMSELMSKLERARMQTILNYLGTNKEINSSIATKLLEVEIKTASRLLSKAEKLDILKSAEKKNKVYFKK